MHARATGQTNAAEKEAERVIGKYKSQPEVADLAHVFRTWQADDIVRQGDPDRAVHRQGFKSYFLAIGCHSQHPPALHARRRVLLHIRLSVCPHTEAGD